MNRTEADGGWVLMGTQLVPADAAHVPVFDRGLLFAHSAYEVTAVFNGRPIDPGAHFDRLARTLAALELPLPHDPATLHELQDALIRRNALNEGLVYLQVSAGDYGGRDFAGPFEFRPRLFGFCAHKRLIGDAARDGIAAITLADERWKRRDLKTTQLLSQALAYRRARAAGAQTAVMHEAGLVTEAASANIWMVTPAGRLVTRDLSPAILAGVTRAAILESRFDVEERAFSLEEARGAREVFTSSTGAMILPVVELDGAPIGDGRPGRMTREVQRQYYRRIGAELMHFRWLEWN